MNHPKAMSITVTSIMLATAVAYAQPAPTSVPEVAPAAPSTPPVPAEPPKPPEPPKPAAPPPGANKFQFTIYGFGQLDIVRDTTNVLGEGAGQSVLPRPPLAGTPAETFSPAKNSRLNMLGNNSRFGFRLNAPEMGGVKAMTVIEADFMGTTLGTSIPTIQPAESAQNTRNLRLRHAFVKIESDIIDITAGQTWDVFGGAVVPHLPAGMAFHGLLGEVFHRNPQLRLSKVIKSDAVNVEIRAAAVRPVQREGEIPDVQGALRFTLNNWKTVHSLGSGLPVVDGLTLDFSGMYRWFKLNEFLPAAMQSTFVKMNGWGASVNALIPIIPATKENQANALALSVEATTGSGIGDMWGITGGLTSPNANGFPNITDAVAAMPMATPPVAAVAAVPYVGNIDPAIVAYNRATGEFVPVKWQSLVVGLQYRLPFEDGRLVLSTNHSYIKSPNISDLAAMGTGYNAAALWKSGLRSDASLSWNIYPAVVVGAMYETIQHTYVTVVNDSDKSIRNHRIHFSILFFF